MALNQSWADFQCIHPQIAAALKDNHMNTPTRIQTEVFSYYTHYHDFLIAAQTGSGKTLAFAAPIISELHQLKQNYGLNHFPRKILGLILTPTRELAQQIHQNIKLALSAINSQSSLEDQLTLSCIIGGMSKEKQLRVLRQHRPQIIIGTPGRLHQLLGEQALSFEYLKYLVIDEADRMIEMGHFREIDQILQNIFMPKKPEFFEKDFEKIKKQLQVKELKEDFYIREKGKKVKLSFNLNAFPTDQIFQLPPDMFTITGMDEEKPKVEKGQKGEKKEKQEKNKKEKEIKIKQSPLSQVELALLSKLKRRIFFVSATLTRQFKGTKYFIKKARTQEEWKQKRQERKQKRKEKQKQGMGKNKKEGQQEQKLEDTIPKLKALLSRAQFSDKPKIIDLSSLLFLPEKLAQRICFTEGDQQRMALLICYLKELPVGAKTIIFANTIKFCKRIQYFVEAFGMQVVNLHSHMQQKQRLKKLQKFKKSTLCNILIATDVAARGLDFHITHVVQMGVPTNGDTYVHRAGRTARASREGESFILVDKKQANRWAQITQNIGETSPNRKVNKFQPAEMTVQDISERVQKLEWIRRNTEVQDSKKMRQMDEEDANNLGVGMQEEVTRKRYDLDEQEKELVRHQVRRKVSQIRGEQKKQGQQQEHSRWKKNKLVLTPDQIKKYL